MYQNLNNQKFSDILCKKTRCSNQESHQSMPVGHLLWNEPHPDIFRRKLLQILWQQKRSTRVTQLFCLQTFLIIFPRIHESCHFTIRNRWQQHYLQFTPITKITRTFCSIKYVRGNKVSHHHHHQTIFSILSSVFEGLYLVIILFYSNIWGRN